MNYQKLLSAVAILMISLSANLQVTAQTKQIDLANLSRQIDVTLKTQANQTFNELIQQAEIQAISLIEQEFASSPSITEIAVTILGDRQGQQVPLLFSRVSRLDWQLQPIIRQWTRYFPTSAVLLGFNPPQKTLSPPVQSIPNIPRNQRVTPTTTLSNSIPPVPSAKTTPSNSILPVPASYKAPLAPRGASLEETDPGYR